MELGQHLVRNVKGLLRQGLVDMQKKMVQNVVSKNVNYTSTSIYVSLFRLKKWNVSQML